MRKVIALVFNYSLNGLLADRDTRFWDYCFSLLDDQGGADHDDETMELLHGASAHVMGRSTYEGMSKNLPGSDHPWAGPLDAGHKVVFSTTMTSASWPNTTISTDLAGEMGRLTDGGDGHVIVWGGTGLWRSLMSLDLIDEFMISMYPFVSDAGTVPFAEVPSDYALQLVSATPKPDGVLELHYRRVK